MNNFNIQNCLRLGELTQSLRPLLVSLPLLTFSFSISATDLPVDAGASSPIPEFDCVIEPSKIVDVGSAVTGIINNINVHRSQMIKRGAVLATLQPGVEQATVELAKARANQNIAIQLRREISRFSHQTQERNQLLVKRSIISTQDMDSLKTETRIAELQIEQEKVNKYLAKLEYRRALAVLQQRTIRSPIDGVVMELFKPAGEYVENRPLLRVAQLDPLHVELIVPVEYLGRISEGMQAKVTSILPGAQSYLATVKHVDVVADAASGTYGVRLALPNPDNKIPAGLRCIADFVQLEKAPNSNDIVSEPDTSDSAVTSAELSVSSSNIQVGDFQIAQHSKQVVEQPKSVMTDANMYKSERYIVLAEPTPDLQHTRKLQDELRAASIFEHYIIREGNHIARLALGFFKSHKNANHRQQLLADKGFVTEIVPVSQN